MILDKSAFIIWRAIRTKNNIDKLKELYDAKNSSHTECEAAGQKFIIAKHFTGDKDVNQIVAELAVNRADREFGLL